MQLLYDRAAAQVIWTFHSDEEMAGPAVTSNNFSAYIATEKGGCNIHIMKEARFWYRNDM